MKYLLFSLFLLFGANGILASNTDFDTKNLRSVFTTAKKTSGSTELIRLYRNKRFEHLIYTVDEDFQKAEGTRVPNANYYRLERNTGVYSLESGELVLKAENTEFSSSLYNKKLVVDNSKVYENKLKSLFKKDQFILRTASKKLYSHPFYLDPEKGRFVTNKEAQNWYDLNELTEFVCRDKFKHQEKIDAFWDYIRMSIQYDDAGYRTGVFTNDQEDIAAIIAGQKRVAVCSGYSWMFKEFLNQSGVRAEYIGGLAKTSSGGIEPHAWNAVYGGKDLQMYDITWGDSWKKIDPALMIYTHLPDNEDQQLIDHPITKEAFKKLAYTTPEREDPFYVPFLPNQKEIEVNNVLNVEFKGSTGTITVGATDLDTRNYERINFKTQLASNGSVFLEIPIESKKAWVTIRSSNGFEIQYLVNNNGINQEIVQKPIIWTAKNNQNLLPEYGERDLYVFKKENTENTVLTADNTRLDSKFEGTFNYDLQHFIRLSASEIENHLIREATKFYGLEEIPGSKHNKTIIGFFKSTGNKKMTRDEDAWCSVFLAVCAKNAGLKGSSDPLARSWLNVGLKVDDPKPGDVVIFWRESRDSYMGHVGIYLGETSEGIICLGGNQDDKVCIKPMNKDMVLGYRRLTAK